MTTPDPPRGHTYSSIVIQSGATAQLGETYTGPHIHLGSTERNPGPKPLTAGAAVRGIRIANEQINKTISSISSAANAPAFLIEIKTELKSIIILDLKTFCDARIRCRLLVRL